jgi:hypothetical protein
MYLLQALNCLGIEPIGVVHAVQFLCTWKIFEQYCAWLELVLVEILESRIVGSRIYSIEVAVEFWYEAALTGTRSEKRSRMH